MHKPLQLIVPLFLGLPLAVLGASCSSSSSAPGVPPPVDAAVMDAAVDGPIDPTDGGPSDAADEEGGHACALPFLGDPSLPVALHLLARGVNGTSTPIVDGDAIPLVTPPQGGKVAFIGVRATNLSPCAVQMIGTLRDPVSQQIRVDGRGINLTAASDGWGTSADSNISTFANVPVCPNQWAMQDAFGHVFELTVKVTDPDGRSAQVTVHVVPACAEGGAAGKECMCSCSQGYVLGQVCP